MKSYLGMSIYILKVTNKARQAIAFLRRNILNCPAHVKCNIYKIMVRPILEYGSTIWDPHTNLNINLLERIQRSAARFCYNDYSTFSSVSTMLNQLELPTLEEREVNLLMFKMLNSLTDISSSQFIPKYRSLRGGYYTQLVQRLTLTNFHFFHV